MWLRLLRRARPAIWSELLTDPCVLSRCVHAVGVEITEATDFGSYAVIWACTYAVTLIACVYFLWPYGYVNVLPAPAAAPAKAA